MGTFFKNTSIRTFWRILKLDVYNILPYYVSITPNNLIKPELPVSTGIPLHLYDKLLTNVPGAQGYHMYTDRYYTSIPLAEELLKMKCHLT